MTREKLEEKIKNRANSDVQHAIDKCRKAVRKALRELGAQGAGHESSFGSAQYSGEAQDCLRVFASNQTGGWPPGLWRRREEEIEKELLETMDTMQRVLAAKDDPGPETAGKEDEG